MPGKPLELHDLEHCSDYDAALLRLDGGACTGLCAAAGSEGAVLAGFCGGEGIAAEGHRLTDRWRRRARP